MIKHCAWCDSEFESDTKSKIYCSVECREKATREKIMARYHMNKRKKRTARTRKCAGGCGTSLSIYNDSLLCASCAVNQKRYNSFLRQLKEIINE